MCMEIQRWREPACELHELVFLLCIKGMRNNHLPIDTILCIHDNGIGTLERGLLGLLHPMDEC